MRMSAYSVAALSAVILVSTAVMTTSGCSKPTATSSSSQTPTQTAAAATTTPPPMAEQTASAPPASKPAPAKEKDGRYFCYVDSVNTSGMTQLVLDYAQFLTGDAAAKAAKAEGAESPPPNDYYVTNTNAKLRTVPVKPSLAVRMTTTAEGPQMDGYDVSLANWIDMVNAGPEAYPPAKTLPYWVTIKGGIVVAIEEQYLP